MKEKHVKEANAKPSTQDNEGSFHALRQCWVCLNLQSSKLGHIVGLKKKNVILTLEFVGPTV